MHTIYKVFNSMIGSYEPVTYDTQEEANAKARDLAWLMYQINSFAVEIVALCTATDTAEAASTKAQAVAWWMLCAQTHGTPVIKVKIMDNGDEVYEDDNTGSQQEL